MDAATLQARIYSGYGKAADRVGLLMSHHRPAALSSSPVLPATKLGDKRVAITNGNSGQFSYDKAEITNRVHVLADLSNAQVFDYLVDSSRTFFICALKPHKPPVAFDCNRVVSIQRPLGTSGVGVQPYGGVVPGNYTAVLTSYPVCITTFGNEGKTDSALPSDVGNPVLKMYCPAPFGLYIRPMDVVTDDLGQRYSIRSTMLNDQGWDIVMTQEVT